LLPIVFVRVNKLVQYSSEVTLLQPGEIFEAPRPAAEAPDNAVLPPYSSSLVNKFLEPKCIDYRSKGTKGAKMSKTLRLDSPKYAMSVSCGLLITSAFLINCETKRLC
jgi:hypothetical protein